MNERLSILITQPEVVFQSSTKIRKYSPESIRRDLKWGKVLIAVQVLLAFICISFIARELLAIFVLEIRENPKSGVWMMFLFAFQAVIIPSLWIQQSILKHKLELIKNGERVHSTSLNDQLKEILNAKKGVYGIVLLIPVFLISLIAGLIESSQVLFQPYFALLSCLFITGLILLSYDCIKYNRLFKKNVELYNNLI